MKKITIYQILTALFIFSTSAAYAWDHSVELGYGFSHDPNNTRYNNQGVLLSGDIYPLWHQPSYYLSVAGAVGQWSTNSPHHKNLTTVAIPISLRYYLAENYFYPPYIFGSVGPAYISQRQFGNNKQAGNLTGSWNLGLGTELKNIDVNLRVQHFSNAYLARPDQGFTIMYLLSVGYLF